MDFMTWAHKVAVAHPELRDAVITTHDEWLDILLADGRSFRFRPGALIRPDGDEATRTDILNRLLSIGIQQAPPAEAPAKTPANTVPTEDLPTDKAPAENTLADNALADNAQIADEMPRVADPLEELTAELTPESLIPIVHSAPLFLRSHKLGDSIVYLPLTDFIAAGLAQRDSSVIRPVYYSEIADRPEEVGELMSQAVLNLRGSTGKERKQYAMEIGVAQIAGCRVLSLMKPEGLQLSWWCDVEMMHNIAKQVSADRPDDIPLFFPVSPTEFYIVFADDPHLIDVVKKLKNTTDENDMVYPLPHTLAADGWFEWVPLPGDELSVALSELRTHYRQRMYRTQTDLMNRWGDFGNLKEYRIEKTDSGESVGLTQWDATDRTGSVPDTELITFTRERSPHPWETDPEVSITLRASVAREIWNEGFKRDDDTWPPRWNVTGFPDAQTLEKLADAKDREF